jgi:hypothetical protein
MLPRSTFELPMRAFTLNQMYCRDMRYKSAGYRQWEKLFFFNLSQKVPQNALKLIRDVFDPAKHAICLKITYYYDYFWSADNIITSKTYDLSNSDKICVDLLFLPKFHKLPTPDGAPNLNTDDRSLVSLSSRKLPSKKGKDYMRISIALIDIESIR